MLGKMLPLTGSSIRRQLLAHIHPTHTSGRPKCASSAMSPTRMLATSIPCVSSVSLRRRCQDGQGMGKRTRQPLSVDRGRRGHAATYARGASKVLEGPQRASA